MPELQTLNRGARADYVLGSPLGWDAFDVVRFTGREALDELFAYDIVLARDAAAPAIATEPLVDQGATLRIASAARWRSVHGEIAEAELLEQTSSLTLYRALLVPPVWRAGWRRRCRTFVDQSVKAVVSSVLENRAPGGPGGRGLELLAAPPAPPAEEPSFAAFAAPQGYYRWALADAARLERPRAFLVQYNESDLDFVRRLLEQEGVGFFFEHGDDGAVMTLSDRPGHAPLFARDETHELVGAHVGGASRDQEVVRALRRAQRVRPAAVAMRDYRWRASLTRLEARAAGPSASELEHFEFPARDEDDPEPGKGPARFALERHEAERQLAEGVSTVRTHEPGYRFRLRDRSGLRDDGEYLVTRVETAAVQLLPESTLLEREPIGAARAAAPREPFFESRIGVLPAEIAHRPARKTDKKLIHGVQTARVTAEEVGEGTELNSDKLGRVRIRFPWDQRESDGTPTSKWVRVAQYWAGPGFGALYVPRVGHEVIVAFEHGDPERPIIVGRVYNEQNPPPYAEPNTTKSTIKSDSVGSDGSSADGFNELRFEDAAGKEQVFLHAQRDLDEVVRANHSTTVGGSQSNTVGGDQSNTVFGKRTHHVHGTELVRVGGDRTTDFQANELHQVAGNRVTGVGGNDVLGVNGYHSVTVGDSQEINVSADRSLAVGGSHTIRVGAVEALTVGGPRSVDVGGPHTHNAPLHSFNSAGDFVSNAAKHIFTCSELVISAGGATLVMKGGLVSLDNGAGASVTLAGGLVAVTSGDIQLTASGTTASVSAGPTNLTAAGNINAFAPLIKLNG
jgi:type VI secretion system secreted protein VgrG